MKGNILKVLVGGWIFLPFLKAHIITVDGDPSDWMTHSVSDRDTFFYLEHTGFVDDKNEAVWIDDILDDLGDGDYSYPTDSIQPGEPRFTGGEADLIEFRFTEGATSTDTFLYFLIIVNDTFNGGEDWPSFIAYFTIDTHQTLSGSKYAPQFSDVQIEGSWVFSGIFSMYTARLLDENYSDINTGHIFAVNKNVYEAALKIDSLKLYHKKYYVSFGIGLEDLGNFREVESLPAQYNGGGGISNWADPDVYDLGYIKSNSQANELSGYSPDNPVVITNAIREVYLYSLDVKEKVYFKPRKVSKISGIYDITGRKVIFVNKKGIYITPKGKKKILKIK
jgi:hypothetical protein